MNIFYRPQYQSVATGFLEQLKTTLPGMKQRQREGLALLWNKPVDREANSEFAVARVAQNPYVYQNSTK